MNRRLVIYLSLILLSVISFALIILVNFTYRAENGLRGEVPKPAQSLVDSFGIQLFLDNNPPYLCKGYEDVIVDGIAYNWCFINFIVPRLRELGLTYYRESLPPSKDLYEQQGWPWVMGDQGGSPSYEYKLRELRYLNTKLGMKCICSVYTNVNNSDGLPRIDQVVNQLKYDRDLVATFQGPNEYNNPGLGTVPRDWLARITRYTEAVYNAFKADDKLKSLPIIGPSFVFEGDQDEIAAQQLGRWVDYAATNFYTSYWYIKEKGSSTAADFLPLGTSPFTLDRHITKFGSFPFPGKPLFITETGYLQTPRIDEIDPNYKKYFITETVAAKYLLRRQLEMFNRNIVKSFIYFFADTNPLGSNDLGPVKYGIINNDGTPKPIFNALKNIVTILKDPGPSFTPTDLNYQLEAAPTVGRSLVQKRDGTNYLILWNEVISSDSPINISATVRFESKKEVKIYDPLTSTAVSQSLTGEEVTINVLDTPTILEIESVQQSRGSGNSSESNLENNSRGNIQTPSKTIPKVSETLPKPAPRPTDTITPTNPPVPPTDNFRLPSTNNETLPAPQVQSAQARIYVMGVLLVFIGLAFMWTFRRVLRRKLQSWNTRLH